MIKNAFLVVALALSSPLAAATYTNSAPIVVVDGGETTSDIVVSGLAGNITGLTVSLNGLSHTYPDDLVFGFVNQTTGLGFVFMSGAGGSTDISNVNLTFSDAAGSQLPESFVGGAITSGTYLPSNYLNYEFVNFDNATSFADFFGTSANGTWTLFVDDTFPADTGQVAGGWSLDFTTSAGTVPEPGTWALMIGGFGLVGAMSRRRRVAFTA